MPIPARVSFITLCVRDLPAMAKFYRSLGWQETGVVPNYALNPDGRPWAATFFWKDLR